MSRRFEAWTLLMRRRHLCAAASVADKTRVIIEHRDGDCRVPGCDQRRWLHIHHLEHRDDGGPTVDSNLCCLCPMHHRMHHKGLLGVSGDPTRPDGLVFTDERGRPIDCGPAPPTLPGHDPPPVEHRWRGPDGYPIDLTRINAFYWN